MKKQFGFFVIVILISLAPHLFAQPSLIFLCETDENDWIVCPCDTGSSIEGRLARLMHDHNSTGPDPSDVPIGFFTWCPSGPPDCCEPHGWFLPQRNPPYYYLKIADEQCCWVSGVFMTRPGVHTVELAGWRCAMLACPTSPPPEEPPPWTTLRFAADFSTLGCPCEYPMPFCEGTLVRLLYDVTANGPSRDDRQVASFSLGAGAGLPPWNGLWSPRPDSLLTAGAYYVSVYSGACCWTTVSLESRTWVNDTVRVESADWECRFDSCATPPCELPYAPLNVIADYDSVMRVVELSWEYPDSVLWFFVYSDGAPLTILYGELREYSYQASVGVHWLTVTTYNECGESPPSVPDSVYVPPAGTSALSIATPVGKNPIRIAPNPFNARAQIHFEVALHSEVELALFDVTGRQVAMLARGEFARGTHHASLDGTSLGSGIYFVRLVAADGVKAEKVLLLK